MLRGRRLPLPQSLVQPWSRRRPRTTLTAALVATAQRARFLSSDKHESSRRSEEQQNLNIPRAGRAIPKHYRAALEIRRKIRAAARPGPVFRKVATDPPLSNRNTEHVHITETGKERALLEDPQHAPGPNTGPSGVDELLDDLLSDDLLSDGREAEERSSSTEVGEDLNEARDFRNQWVDASDPAAEPSLSQTGYDELLLKVDEIFEEDDVEEDGAKKGENERGYNAGQVKVDDQEDGKITRQPSAVNEIPIEGKEVYLTALEAMSAKPENRLAHSAAETARTAEPDDPRPHQRVERAAMKTAHFGRTRDMPILGDLSQSFGEDGDSGTAQTTEPTQTSRLGKHGFTKLPLVRRYKFHGETYMFKGGISIQPTEASEPDSKLGGHDFAKAPLIRRYIPKAVVATVPGAAPEANSKVESRDSSNRPLIRRYTLEKEKHMFKSGISMKSKEASEADSKLGENDFAEAPLVQRYIVKSGTAKEPNEALEADSRLEERDFTKMPLVRTVKPETVTEPNEAPEADSRFKERDFTKMPLVRTVKIETVTEPNGALKANSELEERDPSNMPLIRRVKSGTATIPNEALESGSELEGGKSSEMPLVRRVKTETATEPNEAPEAPEAPDPRILDLQRAGYKPFQGASVTEHAPESKSTAIEEPTSTKEPVSVPWLKAMAAHLGISNIAAGAAEIKRAIARNFGFGSWTELPNKVQQAWMSQGRLLSEGKQPAFPRRVYFPKPVSSSDAPSPIVDLPQGPAESTSEKHNEHSGVKPVSSHINPEPNDKASEAADGAPDSSADESTRQSRVESDVEGHGPQLERPATLTPDAAFPNMLGGTPESGEAGETDDSVFNMLFGKYSESKPKKRDRRLEELRALYLEVNGGQAKKSSDSAEAKKRGTYRSLDTGRPARSPEHGDSIFTQLFPEEAKPQPGETKDQAGGPPQKKLEPPEDALWISLRNEIRNWIPERQRWEINAPDPGEFGSHSTVVVVSGVSNSLLDTDFYRLIPEGQHVEGWAGGLIKVVQARDPLSHDPVGMYYLMFHSKPAADAYIAEVRRLYSLSQRLLRSSKSKARPGFSTRASIDPQPFMTAEEKAAVRSFTICPPTIPLKISSHQWNTGLVGQLSVKNNIADVVQGLRIESKTPGKVLVSVHGAELTVNEMWLTLRDDGRERGHPWSLTNTTDGIKPVRAAVNIVTTSKGRTHTTLRADDDVSTSPERMNEWGYDDDDDEDVLPDYVAVDPTPQNAGEDTAALAEEAKEEERFSRFVITFLRLSIARRFVRAWHKRAVYDESTRQTVVIDAVALL